MTPESLELVIGFIQGVTDPIIVTDLEFNITFVNRAAEALFGYAQEELLGMKPDILNVDPMGEAIQNELYIRLTQGQTYTGRAYNRRKDGSIFKCEYTVMPIKHPNGEVYAYMGLQKDVTRYEDELRDAGAKWIQRYIEKAPIGIVVFNGQGKIVNINNQIAAMIGLQREKIQNMDVDDLIESDVIGFNRGHFEVLLREGVLEDTIPVNFEKGSRRLWRVTARKIDKEEYMAFVEDVTEAENALEALVSSEDQLAAILDSLPGGVIIADIETAEFVYVNQSICKMLGYEKDHLLHLSPMHIHPQNEHLEILDLFQRAIQGERIQSDQYHLIDITGRQLPVRIDTNLLNYNNRPCAIGLFHDLSEAEANRLAIIKSEEQRTILIDTIPTQVWYLKDPATYGHVNQAYATFRGLSKEDLTNKSMYDVFPTALADDFVASNRQVFASGKSFSSTVKVMNAMGDLRILSVTKTPKINAHGKVEYVVCSAEDVTEKEQSEAILKANEERFRHLVQNSSDIIEILDANGTILYVSDQVQRILGYAPEFVLRRNAFDLMHPEDRPRVLDLFYQGVKVPKIQLEATYRYRHIEGHWVHFHAVGTNYLNDPIIGGIVLNVRDITKQKQAEAELQKAMEIVENINLGLHVYQLDNLEDDRTLRMVYVNPAAEWMTGIASRDLIGKTLDESFPGLRDMGIPQRYAKVVRENQAMDFEDLVYSDKRVIESAFSIKAFPLPDLQVAVVFENITEKKLIEQEVVNARDEAQEANQAKTRFLAHMSHEIRTPLNSIIGFSELIQLTPLSPVQKTYCENIHLSGNALLGIINDILDMSKIEAGRLELDPSEVNIRTLLREAVELVRYQAQMKSLVVELVIQEDMPTLLVLDALRLKQVLMNLLSNAVKFTDQGTIRLEASFEDLSEGESDTFGRVSFAVVDTGIGIDKDKLNHIFMPFAQADHSIARRYGGTGLGLVISQLLVEKMGGTIQVTSLIGQGSTFRFSIETTWHTQAMVKENIREAGVSEKRDSAIGVNEESRPSGDERAHGSPGALKILVVDDTPTNLMLISAMIKKLLPNADIVQGINGLEAVAHWQDNRFDLILMDVQMPELDGLSATRQIRSLEVAQGVRTRIIGLSAGILKEEREAALGAGMDGYLTKPIDIKSLDQVLKAEFRHK